MNYAFFPLSQEIFKEIYPRSTPRPSQVSTGSHLLIFTKRSGYCILQVDYRKYVAVNLATSHPHYDEAGNVLNMGTSVVDKGRTKYVIFKIPATVPGKSH